MKRLKYACYATNVCMAIVGNMSPLLFLAFNREYGVSFSLLGALVLINFFTQLLMDLAFSFFSHRFNVPLCLRIMPIMTVAGLLIFALWPLVSDNVYTGFALGTVVFSASSGFAEVLISPTIAALPSDDPDREMSKTHSVYAWGVVGAVLYVTLFLNIFGDGAWQWMTVSFCAVPLFCFALFCRARLPELKTQSRLSGTSGLVRDRRLWLCVCAIFLGAICELMMAQWSSGYIEEALGLPKALGDILGVAMFSVMLGLGRSLYGRIGKNIERTLLLCAVGSVACYVVAALSPIPAIGLIACALTGLAASMMWPGSLVVVAKRFPKGGVFIYAIMAAGGDTGAALGPQILGIVTDAVSGCRWGADLAQRLGITPESLGMRCGMLLGALAAALAVLVFLVIYRTRNDCPCDVGVNE